MGHKKAKENALGKGKRVVKAIGGGKSTGKGKNAKAKANA